MSNKTTIFWMRRDLRLHDNNALHYAHLENLNILPVFIFDTEILESLEDKKDARVEFILSQLNALNEVLKKQGSSIKVMHGKPIDCFRQLIEEMEINSFYTNRDYEPYAQKRDQEIADYLNTKNIGFFTFKDHVIFEKKEIVTDSNETYKVFTPYKNKWLTKFNSFKLVSLPDYRNSDQFVKNNFALPKLSSLGFEKTNTPFPSRKPDLQIIASYDKTRDFPANEKGTTRLGIHLRFGTISIREAVSIAAKTNEIWLNELIWRDFYIMILANFSQLPEKAFKPQYDQIPWRNDEADFQKWCEGKTGYPIVDAGMRELNATGYMHNRVRMIVASFLTKHLLLDWRWGEAYFAKKLLDFELASNNGGWQWAAGTGTDAQPYFRVFNPQSQTDKFDKELKYIKKWVPEYGTPSYPKPMVEHKFARQRAIDTYKQALEVD